MKKILIIICVVIATAITSISYNNVSVEAKIKEVYGDTDSVVMKGKLKKIKLWYAGEWQTNYVLYVNPKFRVLHSHWYDYATTQKRICVIGLSKKQKKKYKNKNVKVWGTIGVTSNYFCTDYGIYDVKKIKKIKKK